jgi:hypothetical protein
MTLDAPRKRLQNLLNVQKLLINVEKITKLYVQRFFTYLFTYHIKITICYSLNKHIPNFYPIFFTHKGIPLDYIEATFLVLISTLYYLFSI